MIFSICFCVLFNVQAVLHIIALEQTQLLTQRAAEKALQSLRTALRMNHEYIPECKDKDCGELGD